ncbi:MAG: trigger factor [Deltaproteobacteria bacterium]|nr:MAG: trigger factor [Deltaproteobacteria bacterium]
MPVRGGSSRDPMEPARVTLEDLTPVRKRLQVEISATDVQAELERAFMVVGRQARLRGFRPGRVPRPVLERTFGEQVRREVLGRLVEESFRQAIETHRLEPVSTPDIDADPLTPGQSLRYSATVDVRPVIEVGNLEGLEVRRPSTTVTDEAVEAALGRLRESAAQLRPIVDRAVVEAGDIVSVDLTSRLEGAESVHREGVLVEAGAGTFPLALERQLVGQHRGAQLTLRVPYPREYPNAGLAGKTAEFDIVIRELRAKELPPLDDDFARDHGRCQSLAELRTRLRADLEREAELRAADAVREMLLDQLIARHPFDVPPTLVERRAETLLAALDVRVPEGTDRERALAEVRTELQPRAERQVRAELLLDAVAVRLGITVDEREVEAEIDAMAARENHAPERLRALYHRPEAHAALHAKLVRERTLARLLAAASAGARTVPASVAPDVAREK